MTDRKKSRARTGLSGRAKRNIDWIEEFCWVPQGKFVGEKIWLRDWQKELLREVYDGQTRDAIISFGRKNGKTSLAAMLVLLHLVGPEFRRNAELYSTGLSREQAAKTYNLAAQMVRFSPELRDVVYTRDTVKQLHCEPRGTTYTALSADAATAMGGSPVFVVHDELGQVRGERHLLYEALETGRGAHEESLSVVISTQAPTDADLLSKLIEDGLECKDGKVKVFLWSAPEDLDPFSEEAIKLANPAFGDFLDRETTLADANKARRLPSREMEYRNLILNQRVSAEDVFIPKSIWDMNASAPSEIPNEPLFGGLDLSETGDLTAFVLVDMDYNIYPTFWLPGEGLDERSRSDRVPYDRWAREGILDTTTGRSVEYEFVANYLAQLFSKQDIKKIAFDRFNMRHLRPWLIKAGMAEDFIDSHFVDFGQGYVSMGPALRGLESLMLNGKMRHGGHEIMTMCCANAIAEMNSTGDRKLSKRKSTGRIDGMVALAMAVAVLREDIGESHVFPIGDTDSILEAAMEG